MTAELATLEHYGNVCSYLLFSVEHIVATTRVTTLSGKSWKVVEFSKTIFQAWKVMENSQGHGKSWKIIVEKEWSPCTTVISYLREVGFVKVDCLGNVINTEGSSEE